MSVLTRRALLGMLLTAAAAPATPAFSMAHNEMGGQTEEPGGDGSLCERDSNACGGERVGCCHQHPVPRYKVDGVPHPQRGFHCHSGRTRKEQRHCQRQG